MHIEKYLLPAVMTATAHVALLWSLPEAPFTQVREVPVTLPRVEPGPVAVPDDPPEDPSAGEVTPLLGKPSPVSLEEPPATVAKAVFTLAPENARPAVALGKWQIPATVGIEDGDPAGRVRAEAGIFVIGTLDRTPRARVQLPPEYPYAMKQRGVSGSVLVEFDVDRSGRVTRATAIGASDREFVEPALRAVRGWRFEPGRRDGRTVPFRMTIPIEFGLEPAA